ncbi:MAG TPA: hypothetical protein VFV93_01065, partial [Thermomicrobiales bacterium]|nr:hypothetical protein [Thermomicrobiales bacterium]
CRCPRKVGAGLVPVLLPNANRRTGQRTSLPNASGIEQGRHETGPYFSACPRRLADWWLDATA